LTRHGYSVLKENMKLDECAWSNRMGLGPEIETHFGPDRLTQNYK
jgi:hypothetical protein